MMFERNEILVLALVCFFFVTSVSGCAPKDDEAMKAGRDVESFAAADEDFFHDMDGGRDLSPNGIRGRNTWNVWTGGNDRFWNYLAGHSFGSFDLLKTLSSHESQHYGRRNRWYYLGLVNEPCFEAPDGPDPERYGLWLDRRVAGSACPPDPFADAEKYPGVMIGARGENVPVGSYYGEPSGVVGLRLFPNPDFDEKAERDWDPVRYYGDADYYYDPDLVRPYRVGMSCAFCHVGPSPTNAPADPENPEWANLNSNPGAQYFWVDRIFVWDNAYRDRADRPTKNERNFIFQLFHTNPPGALDTSFVSTDNINNPRTMNAVYNVIPRLVSAGRWGKEGLSGGELDNNQFQDFDQTRDIDPGIPTPGSSGTLADYWQDPEAWTARVLKDGADSVGILGALNRVYINIGLYSEEWLEHFRMLVGGKEISPIEIAEAKEHSVYWNATANQTADLALFFVETARPDLLAGAPGGEAYLTRDESLLERGKVAFAEQCARCHSSKVPALPASVTEGCEGGGSGANYLECWDRYWDYTKSDEFKSDMREIVMAPDFLDGNFLSTERRVPVTLLETNACSPLASNAIGGNIWDNFSSSSYKELPSVGEIEVHHPITGEPYKWQTPGGGRGYTRPASLVSLWSTAPYLLNNSVGDFNPDPSVAGRMASFQDSIEKMLWPERRKQDIDVVRELGLDESRAVDVPGYMYRTTASSCLKVPKQHVPEVLYGALQTLFPFAIGAGGIELGPIPAGTPVNLISNIKLQYEPSTGFFEKWRHRKKLIGLIKRIKGDLKQIGGCSEDELQNLDRQKHALEIYREGDLVDQLLEVSACPDLVVNRGHYFGTGYSEKGPGLSDDDKLALIEFLKTL